MRTATRTTLRLGCLIALGALLTLLLGGGTASAAVGPKWAIHTLSSTTAAPGEVFEYIVEGANVGDESIEGSPVEFTAALPAGLVAREESRVFIKPGEDPEETQFVECTAGDGSPLPSLSDPTHVKCVDSEAVHSDTFIVPHYQRLRLQVEVEAGVGEGAVLTPSFEVSGGGGGSAAIVDPTLISAAAPAFGIDAFDNQMRDDAGAPSTEAGAHPASLATAIDFNTHYVAAPTAGTATPVEPLKDAFVDLPPGFVADPTLLESCALAAVGAGLAASCPPTSQVGTVTLRANNHYILTSAAAGPYPVYNLEAPVGSPARLGFNIRGTVVVIDASLRSDGDYGITTGSRDTSEGLSIAGLVFEFWGDPGASVHDQQRVCPGANGYDSRCPGALESVAFFRNPTACEGPVASTLRTDSWFDPGQIVEEATLTHLDPGYPFAPEDRGAPQGFEGCEAEPFDPSLAGAPPSGAQAGEPSSFAFDLSMPQEGLEDPEAISESDLRKAVVTLPKGVRLNPSSADGLGACSPAQVALITPVGQADANFETARTNCPESSKIGSLSIKTPLLDHELEGSVYLAEQNQNPFGSLLALYLVVKDAKSGVNIVLPGKVDLDPATGQITTTFDDNPQLPFEALHLELKAGPRAAISLPGCGTYTTHSTFTGWSGKVVSKDSSFKIEQGCGGGFDPKLTAGTENPLAGHTSPFSLRITRSDSSQELGSLSLTMPPGLSGYLKGIPYCADSALAAVSGDLGSGRGQESSPSCPPASQVGTVTVGAGAGPSPFYTSSERAYLAGPYKGAPLSLAVVAPAVAGPFDLGSVVVRNALHVDPTTAQITAVSDPLPSILYGIPLQLRDVRVNLNRDHFTLNPTSCEAFQVTSTITSTEGASANPSQRFQAAGCEKLGFKPRLSLKLRGGTTRSKHPGLTAVLEPRVGNANAGRIQVALPHSEFLAQSHIRTICTRVQFAADACPAGSVYGRVTATSPILDQPLSGDVYLRSSDNPLPDMVLKLKGPASQPIEIDAVGRIDSHKGGIRTTFAQVPDAPLTKVVLRLPAGRKSLLENSTNICRGDHRATVKMEAHNGKLAGFKPKLQVKCGHHRAKGKKHHRRS